MKLYRLMKADADGKPLLGKGSMMLGVRPNDPTASNQRADVFATSGGDMVQPNEGGLSCYSDPEQMRLQSKKLLLWAIDAADLPNELAVVPADEPHYHIEPQTAMTLDELQQMLAGTRDRWQRVEPEDKP